MTCNISSFCKNKCINVLKMTLRNKYLWLQPLFHITAFLLSFFILLNISNKLIFLIFNRITTILNKSMILNNQFVLNHFQFWVGVMIMSANGTHLSCLSACNSVVFVHNPLSCFCYCFWLWIIVAAFVPIRMGGYKINSKCCWKSSKNLIE